MLGVGQWKWEDTIKYSDREKSDLRPFERGGRLKPRRSSMFDMEVGEGRVGNRGASEKASFWVELLK